MVRSRNLATNAGEGERGTLLHYWWACKLKQLFRKSVAECLKKNSKQNYLIAMGIYPEDSISYLIAMGVYQENSISYLIAMGVYPGNSIFHES